MPTGTGTIQKIKEEASKIQVNLDAVQVPVDTIEPLPRLAEDQGIVDTPFTERVGLAFETSSGGYNFITGLMDDTAQEPDYNFNIWDHKDILDGTTGSVRDALVNSVSLQDANSIKFKADTEQAEMQELMRNGGISGTALAMFAGTVGDPVFWAGMLAEGSSALQIPSKLSRLERALATGKIAAITGGVETAVLAGQKVTVDAEDVQHVMLGGMILGTAARAGMDAIVSSGTGTAKSLFSKHADLEADKLARTVQDQLDENLSKGTSGGHSKVESVQEDSIFGKYKPDEEAELMADVSPEDVLGSEKVVSFDEAFHATLNEAKEAGRFNPEEVIASKTFKVLEKNPLMTDFIRLFKSKGDAVKFFSSELLENASGIAGRQKTAAVLKFVMERKHLNDVMPKFRDAYASFTKENKVSWYNSKYWGKTREDFNRVVRLELEKYRNASSKGIVYKSEAPQYIQEVVGAWRKNMQEIAESAKAAGVKGFDDIIVHDGYVPLLWNGHKLNALGKKDLARYSKLLSRGYTRAGVDEKSAEIISKAVLNRQMKKALGVDANPGALLTKDSREFLRELLSLNNVSVKEQESLFSRIDVTLAERGKSARTKSRVPVDLTTSDGEFQLLDIVNNDMTAVGTKYFSEISGRVALARKGITNDGAYRAVVTTILNDSQKAGSTTEELLKMREILEGVYDQFLSRPVDKGINKGARRLQELAMTSMLGTVGVAQMAESANVIASIGLSNLMKYSSELRQFRRAVIEGTADKTLLGELQAHIGGMWDEHLFFRPEVRLDQTAGNTSDIFTAIDNVLAGAKEKLGYMSGMNQIKNLQQQFVAIGQVNKVIGMLKSGKDVDRLLKRFADIGWDDSTLKNIKKYIDNGTVEFQENGSVAKLNLEKWDAKTYEDFSIGMHRHSAQIIQFPMIGETAYWQHSTIGSMLSQFRSFTMLSIEKQSARQIRMADEESFTAVSYGIGLSYLLYVAKAHAMSIGRPNREEYLEKRLSVGASINGAIQWSGAMGAASEIINVMAATGILPKEVGSGSIGRSGGGFDITSQVPSISVATKGINLAGSVMQQITPFGEADIGKREVNAAFGITPLGNTLPAVYLKNIINSSMEE